MVVLTAPPPEPQAVEGVQIDATEDPPVVVGTPPRNLSQSIQQIKGSSTPPRRATEEDVTMLRPAPSATPVGNGNEVRRCNVVTFSRHNIAMHSGQSWDTG